MSRALVGTRGAFSVRVLGDPRWDCVVVVVVDDDKGAPTALSYRWVYFGIIVRSTFELTFIDSHTLHNISTHAWRYIQSDFHSSRVHHRKIWGSRGSLSGMRGCKRGKAGEECYDSQPWQGKSPKYPSWRLNQGNVGDFICRTLYIGCALNDAPPPLPTHPEM